MASLSSGQVKPTRMPVIPPRVESTTVSTRNWRMISRRLAPRARRIPISRVLSVTVASMMFMMPIPPTTSEMPAISPMKIMNIIRVIRACSRSSNGTVTP